jgi:PAS domain S-box-containing protein
MRCDISPMQEAESLRLEVEKLRAENDFLRRQGDLFRSVFTEGNMGIALIGVDLRLEHANRALATMLGRTPAELVGTRIADLTHPDDTLSLDLAQKLFAGEIPAYRVEKRYFRKDGAIIWTHLTATAIRDAGGKPLFGLAMIEDITERRLYNLEREQLISRLQDALANVKTLSGLLPMCAWCKRIRDDQGSWSDVEHYVRHQTNADFTHGICPDCQEQVRRDLGLSPEDEVAP